MALVTEAMLAQLRSVAYRGLVTEIVVMRPSQVENDFGSEDVLATVGVYNCWVREMSTSAPGSMFDRIATVGLFRIDFEWGVDVEPGDHLFDGINEYTVSDTNSGNSVAVFHKAIARLVE